MHQSNGKWMLGRLTQLRLRVCTDSRRRFFFFYFFAAEAAAAAAAAAGVSCFESASSGRGRSSALAPAQH